MMNKAIFCALLLVSLTLGGCYYDNEEELYQFVQSADCGTVTEGTYQAQVLPSLESYCLRCHNNLRQDGNVNLEGYANVLTYVNDGSLLGSTNHDPGFSIMPPSGLKIPSCEIEAMRLWIDSGAPNN